ncbi:hypothetical protein [Paraburkholderia sp. 32]|uniref:hypothetical protein n=1 Tax=Paraburkholderia sp. 32 TaxID=2991057 RepID=UPI003D1F6C8A
MSAIFVALSMMCRVVLTTQGRPPRFPFCATDNAMTEKLEACTVLRVFKMRDECIAFRLNFGLFSIWQRFSMPAQRCFTGGQCFIPSTRSGRG